MAVADIIGTLVQAQFLETLRSQPRIVAITRPVNIPNGHRHGAYSESGYQRNRN